MNSIAFDPKVSIIIPVFNGSNFVRQAIDSALSQTYRNCEVIVVNDGSTDGGETDKIVKSYGNKIHYVHKRNGGVASALNEGIAKMTGEYFSWLSHDDLYYPEKIEKHINHLRSIGNKQLITHCASEFIDEQSRKRGPLRIEEKYLKNKYLAVLSTSLGGCTLLVPRACFDRVGLFNEKLKTVQDNEMWLRLAKEGFEFEYIPEILVQSRIHREQGSVTMKQHHRKERGAYYSWAIRFIGNDLASIAVDIGNLLLDKKCFAAHRELVKLRFGKDWPLPPAVQHYLLRGIHTIRSVARAALRLSRPLVALIRRVSFT